MGYRTLLVLSQNQSFTISTFTRTVLCTHTSLVSCVRHVDVFAYIISPYTQNPLSVSYSTILLALLLLLGRRLCRATYILCSSLLSSARSPLLPLLLLSFITVRPEVWVWHHDITYVHYSTVHYSLSFAEFHYRLTSRSHSIYWHSTSYLEVLPSAGPLGPRFHS